MPDDEFNDNEESLDALADKELEDEELVDEDDGVLPPDDDDEEDDEEVLGDYEE